MNLKQELQATMLNRGVSMEGPFCFTGNLIFFRLRLSRIIANTVARACQEVTCLQAQAELWRAKKINFSYIGLDWSLYKQ